MEEQHQTHFLDLKIPLGGLLAFYGLVLTAYSFWAGNSVSQQEIGVSINLVWGVVLLVVGGSLLGFVLSRRKK